MEDGMRSAARASASSGVCLYLKVSKAPGALGAAGFDGLEDTAAGGSFFGAVAAAGAAEGVELSAPFARA